MKNRASELSERLVDKDTACTNRVFMAAAYLTYLRSYQFIGPEGVGKGLGTF